VSVAIISFIAYIIAVNRDSSIMGLVSVAWSGFGSCFGALVLLSLYWKRINLPGAVAGIISGGLAVIVWEYIVFIPSGGEWVSLSRATGLYSLVPGFLISAFSILLVSLVSGPPDREITEKFEQAAVAPIFEE
jgi:sodium/proline symporter